MTRKLLKFLDDEKFLGIVGDVVSAGSKAKESAEKNFGRNVIDPFSMLFEMYAFDLTEPEWRENEMTRQAQKSLSNKVGSFHQRILGSIDGWEDTGAGGGIDVINRSEKVIADIKNKYNTVKGSSLFSLYKDLETRVMTKGHEHRGFIAYYVEVLPKNPTRYNVPFRPSDSNQGSRAKENELIRRIDGASFYALATGRTNALHELFEALPKAIELSIESKKTKISENWASYFSKAFAS